MAQKNPTLASRLKRAKANQLRKEAEENSTLSLKSDGVEKTLKEGKPLDQAVKKQPYDSSKFGMSMGNTLNMDNYESLRVDVWLSDEIQEGENVEEAFDRVQSILEETLEKICLPYR